MFEDSKIKIYMFVSFRGYSTSSSLAPAAPRYSKINIYMFSLSFAPVFGHVELDVYL